MGNGCDCFGGKDIWRGAPDASSVGRVPSAVLVAEPESETREYLGRQLRDDGFDVLDAARRSEALELAERIRPDVVLLAELDLCLRLRRGEPGRSWDRNVPVILLAPSSDPVERVRALDRGADDVIGRPFAYEELLARIRAVLRRTTSSTAEVLVADDLVVDRSTRRVSVRDTLVSLSAKEFDLLAWLAADPYRVWTKDELLRHVWDFKAIGRTRTLESHASRLRKKLRDAGGGDQFIVNVWGVGYRLLD
jgi:DNA-binding response OmpR family regulator